MDSAALRLRRFSAWRLIAGHFGGQRPPLQHRCSGRAVIAGPGAMMAVIVLTDNDVYTVPERIETGVVLLVVLFLTYLLLLFSDAILRVIGRQGASVLVRVMGLILCSLAVEIVLTALGVVGWTPGAH
ncbi:MAG TPA: MarC family protein [Pyrinomonadaceae bacterium]|nr:MarC family protein [Pyrinomonadaceae bacterium]